MTWGHVTRTVQYRHLPCSGLQFLDSAAQVRLSMPEIPLYYILTLDSAAQRASRILSIAWERAALLVLVLLVHMSHS